MDTFPECLQLILAEEGRLNNHRQDPGGLTQFGISQRSYPNVDIARLTLAQASAIYLTDYWNPIKGDLLPAGLDLMVFDCAVNQGTTTAAVLLQKALGIKADGNIGPITLTRASQAMPDLLITFAAERALRYEFNRNEQTFGRGWYRRLFHIQNLAVKAYPPE
jgi:lysozyme family protein